MFGLANIVIDSADVSTPRSVLEAIPDASTVRDKLRGCVEKQRVRKGVREIGYA